ncbi:hypothetical protein Anas_06361, partial [Armadillidium nasatum]
MSIGPKRVC